MDAKKAIDKIFESDPIFLDRHGSMPNRPKSVRFKKKEDYNDHMGFEASLPDDAVVPKEQIATIRKLMQQGYVVTGHSKWPDHPRHVEILMTLKTNTSSRYADIGPDGKIA
jgi:hypothetical protein